MAVILQRCLAPPTLSNANSIPRLCALAILDPVVMPYRNRGLWAALWEQRRKIRISNPSQVARQRQKEKWAAMQIEASQPVLRMLWNQSWAPGLPLPEDRFHDMYLSERMQVV